MFQSVYGLAMFIMICDFICAENSSGVKSMNRKIFIGNKTNVLNNTLTRKEMVSILNTVKELKNLFEENIQQNNSIGSNLNSGKQNACKYNCFNKTNMDRFNIIPYGQVELKNSTSPFNIKGDEQKNHACNLNLLEGLIGHLGDLETEELNKRSNFFGNWFQARKKEKDCVVSNYELEKQVNATCSKLISTLKKNRLQQRLSNEGNNIENKSDAYGSTRAFEETAIENCATTKMSQSTTSKTEKIKTSTTTKFNKNTSTKSKRTTKTPSTKNTQKYTKSTQKSEALKTSTAKYSEYTVNSCEESEEHNWLFDHPETCQENITDMNTTTESKDISMIENSNNDIMAPRKMKHVLLTITLNNLNGTGNQNKEIDSFVNKVKCIQSKMNVARPISVQAVFPIENDKCKEVISTVVPYLRNLGNEMKNSLKKSLIKSRESPVLSNKVDGECSYFSPYNEQDSKENNNSSIRGDNDECHEVYAQNIFMPQTSSILLDDSALKKEKNYIERLVPPSTDPLYRRFNAYGNMTKDQIHILVSELLRKSLMTLKSDLENSNRKYISSPELHNKSEYTLNQLLNNTIQEVYQYSESYTKSAENYGSPKERALNIERSTVKIVVKQPSNLLKPEINSKTNSVINQSTTIWITPTTTTVMPTTANATSSATPKNLTQSADKYSQDRIMKFFHLGVDTTTGTTPTLPIELFDKYRIGNIIVINVNKLRQENDTNKNGENGNGDQLSPRTQIFMEKFNASRFNSSLNIKNKTKMFDISINTLIRIRDFGKDGLVIDRNCIKTKCANKTTPSKSQCTRISSKRPASTTKKSNARSTCKTKPYAKTKTTSNFLLQKFIVGPVGPNCNNVKYSLNKLPVMVMMQNRCTTTNTSTGSTFSYKLITSTDGDKKAVTIPSISTGIDENNNTLRKYQQNFKLIVPTVTSSEMATSSTNSVQRNKTSKSSKKPENNFNLLIPPTVLDNNRDNSRFSNSIGENKNNKTFIKDKGNIMKVTERNSLNELKIPVILESPSLSGLATKIVYHTITTLRPENSLSFKNSLNCLKNLELLKDLKSETNMKDFQNQVAPLGYTTNSLEKLQDKKDNLSRIKSKPLSKIENSNNLNFLQITENSDVSQNQKILVSEKTSIIHKEMTDPPNNLGKEKLLKNMLLEELFQNLTKDLLSERLNRAKPGGVNLIKHKSDNNGVIQKHKKRQTTSTTETILLKTNRYPTEGPKKIQISIKYNEDDPVQTNENKTKETTLKELKFGVKSIEKINNDTIRIMV